MILDFSSVQSFDMLNEIELVQLDIKRLFGYDCYYRIEEVVIELNRKQEEISKEIIANIADEYGIKDKDKLAGHMIRYYVIENNIYHHNYLVSQSEFDDCLDKLNHTIQF